MLPASRMIAWRFMLWPSGRAEPGYHEKAYALRGKLSAEDRALLALAVAGDHGPVGMVAELLRAGSPRASSNRRFGCAARAAAIRLLASIGTRPDDPTVDRLISDLMREQKQAQWETTQGNAWALLALTEYARRVETKLRPAEAKSRLAANRSRSASMNPRTSSPVFFDYTNLPDTTLVLSEARPIASTPPSPSRRARPKSQPRQDRGLGLQRRYDRLDDDNQPQDLTGLRVGDRVLVTLRLSSASRPATWSLTMRCRPSSRR